MKYDFAGIEKKWQDKWDETGVFYAENNSSKPKFYCLIGVPVSVRAGTSCGTSALIYGAGHRREKKKAPGL